MTEEISISSEDIAITTYLLSSSVEIGENYERVVEIRNNTNQDLPEGTMAILKDGYHEYSITRTDPIRSFDSISIKLKIRVAGGVTIDDLPSLQRYEYKSGTQTVKEYTVPTMGTTKKKITFQQNCLNFPFHFFF